MLRYLTTKPALAALACGRSGKLLQWADAACTALAPHGFSSADVGCLVRMYPQFVVYLPSTLADRFVTLQSTLGGSAADSELCEVCLREPDALAQADNASVLINNLVASGVCTDNEGATLTVLQHPSMLRCRPESPWWAVAAVKAAGAPAACIVPATISHYSVAQQILPRLVWYMADDHREHRCTCPDPLLC